MSILMRWAVLVLSTIALACHVERKGREGGSEGGREGGRERGSEGGREVGRES